MPICSPLTEKVISSRHQADPDWDAGTVVRFPEYRVSSIAPKVMIAFDMLPRSMVKTGRSKLDCAASMNDS